jgi:ubiquitin carboxyl-terminal hydrolase 22/27/51
LYKNTCKNNEGGDPSDKLHSTAKSKINDKTKLEDCIHNFTQAEVLTSFSCSNCKLTKEAKKQLTMKNLPIVCCFHLKRFQKSNKIHKKISEHISFPVILDMTPYMSTTAEHARSQINADMYETIRTTKTTDSTASSDNSSPPLPPPPPPPSPPLSNENTYFLFAVVNHHGTLETGHYTSFVRHNTHEWFKCDDHIISKASVNDVMQSEGYLLFYHKMWNNFQSNDYLT